MHLGTLQLNTDKLLFKHKVHKCMGKNILNKLNIRQ